MLARRNFLQALGFIPAALRYLDLSRPLPGPEPITGKASIEGIPGTFDVTLHPVASTESDNFEDEIINDVNGFPVAWIRRSR